MSIVYSYYFWHSTYKIMAVNKQVLEEPYQQLRYLVQYGFDNTRCRRKWILPLFHVGEHPQLAENCEACDVCLKRPHTLGVPLSADDSSPPPSPTDATPPPPSVTPGATPETRLDGLQNMDDLALLVSDVLTRISEIEREMGRSLIRRVTLHQLCDLIKGSPPPQKSETSVRSKHHERKLGNLFGCGKDYSKDELLWFCAWLVLDGLIREVPAKVDKGRRYAFYVEVRVD